MFPRPSVKSVSGAELAMGDALLRQTWTVSAVLVNMACQGVMMSHTSCLLPALQDPESTIRADLNTASLLASCFGLAGVPGYIVSAVLMDVCGRRLTHALMVLPAMIGWTAIYFARSIPTLMVGRVLGGLSTGGTVLLGAMVIGEYSDSKYRGVFLNLKTVAFGVGGISVHVLGHLLSWRTIALCAIFPHLLSITITLTWSESPPWLASKGKFDESKKSFLWLRGNTEATNKELDALISAQMARLAKPQLKLARAAKFTIFLKKLFQKDFLKPCCIVFVSVLVLEASGRHLFPAYALQIIGDLTGDSSQSFYYTLAIDVIITASAVGSSFLIKVMKRRALLFSTGFAACAVLMIACAHLSLVHSNIISNHAWISLGLFVVYFILANLGCSPIPLALLGEIFPLSHKQIGSSVAGIWMSIALMLSLQITPHLIAGVKVQGTFFVYGVTMGLALLILYYMLPETKDRTLQEIEDYFNHGKYRDDDDINDETRITMIKEQDC